MDWANERWVKLYTRNSVEWELLAWQARALLPLLMRRCDASGVIDFPSRVGATRSIAKYLDVPEDVVAAGLDDLESSETIEIRDCSLLLVNFVEAQEANATPAERQRRKRERAKRKPANTSVTRGHAESRGVTTRESREKEETSTACVRARSNPHAETVGDSMDEVREEGPPAAPRQLPVIPLGAGEARACDGHLLELDMVRREVEAQTGRRIGPLSRRMEHTLPGLQFALVEIDTRSRHLQHLRADIDGGDGLSGEGDKDVLGAGLWRGAADVLRFHQPS